MRAVYWKELRELALVGIPLAIAAAFTGWEYSWPAGNTDELLSLVILGGLAVGIAHGLLDRQRRDDLFLRHRPLPRWRLEAARTAAGATVLLIAAAVLLVFLVWGASHHAHRIANWGRGARWTHRPDLRLAPRDVTAGLGAYAIVLSVAVWAGIRWILSAPRLWQIPLLLLAAPFLLAGPVGRTNSLGVALALMVGIAAVCTWQLVSRRRAFVTLFLCGWLVLEGAASLRVATQEMQFELYPTYALDAEGEIHSWAVWGNRTYLYDLERNEFPMRVPRVLLGGPLTFHPEARSSLFDWMDRIPPYFDERDRTRWAVSVVHNLNSAQTLRPDGWIVGDAPVAWGFKDGRFVCRARGTGDVVAGFGPDGYAAGPDGASGERFKGLFSIDASGDAALHLRHVNRSGWFRLEFENDPDRDVSLPIRVDVSWQPRQVLHRSIMLNDRLELSLVERGDQLDFVRGADEILLSVPWDREEELIGSRIWLGLGPMDPNAPVSLQDLRAGIVTRLRPPHPVFATYRVRFLQGEHAPLVHDIPVQPETPLEHTISGFGGLVALARPLPLVLASYAAAAPPDFESMASWWWLDPWFSGRRMTGWLVGAVVLAALLAWWARRQALRRCATMRAVHFWTAVALVLGPLGVIWMRLTVPWAPVEPVGAGVRAVNRDATPANDAPWPDPAPVGTEVFAR